jgi:integrase/recombinase XerD
MVCEEVGVTRHNRDAMSETSLPDPGDPVRGGNDERSVPGAGDRTAWPVCQGLPCRACQAGYASSSAVNQLKLAGHLSRWMTIEGLSAPELVPVEIERYVAARRAARYRHNLSEQGLRPLLEYLRGLGVLAGPAPSSPATPHERLLEDYASYLVAERSLASGTVCYYLRFARLFVSSVSDETGLGLGAITTGDVSRFVVEQCGRRSVGSARTLVMALRSLLRFLHVTGLSATPLAGAVPAVAPWRERSLPEGLSPAAVARLLGSCDHRGATGRRDYAILVVLLRLGLRAGEAAALELDDIDWRRGELVVRGKGDRREQLPLPVDVGEALAAYLRRGRPRCQDRHLFLRVKAPTAGLKADGVTKVVHAACRRAGLPVAGAHRLRRTNACATLRRGGSLAEVGEILRQRSAFTQALYAKVDRAALERVARPWPGARS